jgi:hypothetical protein
MPFEDSKRNFAHRNGRSKNGFMENEIKWIYQEWIYYNCIMWNYPFIKIRDKFTTTLLVQNVGGLKLENMNLEDGLHVGSCIIVPGVCGLLFPGFPRFGLEN